MTNKKSVVVLISGSGSNLQAIIDAAHHVDFPGEISAVISNKPDAYGLERARKAGIAAIALDHKTFSSRETFDEALKDEILKHSPDLVVLAGFMRILTPDFVAAFEGKMLNIHPSLLPKYPGLHTHQRAIDAGDSEHGVTVHFVTSELDGGPAIIQACVPILEGDTADALAARVLEKEHIIYPLAVQWLLQENIAFQSGTVIHKGETLDTPLQLDALIDH